MLFTSITAFLKVIKSSFYCYRRLPLTVWYLMSICMADNMVKVNFLALIPLVLQAASVAGSNLRAAGIQEVRL